MLKFAAKSTASVSSRNYRHHYGMIPSSMPWLAYKQELITPLPYKHLSPNSGPCTMLRKR